MRIHYGYTNTGSIDSIKQLILVPWRAHYKAVSKSDLYPYSLKDGYPPPRMYGRGWITETSAIRILTHLFDNDDTIGDTFRVRYKLECIMKDGRKETKTLKDIDMVHKRHGTLNPNLFIVEETFVLSKFFTNYKDIDLMTIAFKQLDSTNYGNESILEVVSVHFQQVPQ